MTARAMHMLTTIAARVISVQNSTVWGTEISFHPLDHSVNHLRYTKLVADISIWGVTNHRGHRGHREH